MTPGWPPPAKCLASVWRWELQDKGKCVLSVDGSKANGTWTLNNGAFTVEGGGIDCAGRLENGVLTLENVMDMGITLVFYKDGVVPPPPAAAAGGAGYYVIDIIVQGSETYEADTLEELGISYYLVLGEDGSLVINTDEYLTGTWADGVFEYQQFGEDVINEYVLEQDTLTLVIGEKEAAMSLIFVRSEGAPPPPQAADATGLSEALAWWECGWYGYWIMTMASGDYAHFEGEVWDCAAIVKVNPDGTATMYLWDDYEEMGTMELQIDADSGSGLMGGAIFEYGVFYERILGRADWIIRPGSEEYDNFMMIDGSHSDSDNTHEQNIFTYEIYLRPWGLLWDDMPSDERPPSHDDWYADVYMDPMMETYEETTIGGEPVYIHSAFSDGYSGGGAADEPDDDEPGNDEPAAPADTLHPGEPSSSGGGQTTQEIVRRTYKWLGGLGLDWSTCTYDVVRSYIGVDGKDSANTGPNVMSELGDHYFTWYASSTEYIFIGFRPNSSGEWIICGMNSSGFSDSDLVDIVVSYD